MTNLPKVLRQKLSDIAEFSDISLVECQTSSDNSTKKYLFELSGNTVIDTKIQQKNVYVESVLMEYNHGLTICVSSQAGCRMRCDFCASGIQGLDRNLSTGEILAQLYAVSKNINKRIDNIVLMGSGEPLDNYDNALKFIKIINDKRGSNIGQRHITLSTCGVVPKIYSLLDEKLQITLAISLHAPNDEIRKRLMPIAKAYNIDELLAACKAYGNLRRVSFEYIMIKGVNDSIACAVELRRRIKGINCHINLIPANNVDEKGYVKSDDESIKTFANILGLNNIDVTIRRELGSDIDAACGQLRNKTIALKNISA